MKVFNRCIKCLNKTTNKEWCGDCWKKYGSLLKINNFANNLKDNKAKFTKEILRQKQCAVCKRNIDKKYKICFICWQQNRKLLLDK